MASAIAGASLLLHNSIAKIAACPVSCHKTPPSYITTWNSLKKTPYCLNRISRLAFTLHGWQQPLVRASSSSSSSDVVETSETEFQETVVESNDEQIEESDSEVLNDVEVGQEAKSVIQTLLASYTEAIAANDESKIGDIENQLQLIEHERNDLGKQIAFLKEELSAFKEKYLRLNADFINFRNRSERERLSLASNIKGEVIESLLPMVDNFERAKLQIKPETEGEEKLNESYQSIYKQFVQIMRALEVTVVETVGKPFDPTVHEAIMREESTEYEEGIILEEFRRGFTLGDRLLRPAMVKVSAGPGPAQSVEASTETADSSSKAIERAGSSLDMSDSTDSSPETADVDVEMDDPQETTQDPEKPTSSGTPVAN